MAGVGIARTDLGFGWRCFSIQTDSVLAAKVREVWDVADQSEKWDGWHLGLWNFKTDTDV